MVNFEREDELIQPSTNDEIAVGLIEANVIVKNGCYEIPVLFKTEELKTLPNIYTSCSNIQQPQNLMHF